jgi:hypothetical protein
MSASAHTLLAIYLNDHYAGSTAGVELARRARAGNEGNGLGGLLNRLADEIEEDRSTLAAVMEAVGVKRDPLKPRLAWAGEKLGRLKLNGQLTGQSPLSRVVELEGLELGITGKASLWRALGELADPRLEAFDFESLAERARRQREELEPHRVAAVREAFAGAAR